MCLIQNGKTRRPTSIVLIKFTNNLTQMKLTISYSELHNYIAAHYHMNVSFTRVSDNEVCVSVTQKIFIKTIQVNLNLKVEEVSNESVLLIYNSGFGIDLIVSGLLTFVEKKLPEYGNLISKQDGNRISLHLSKIEKLKEAFYMVELTGIRILNDSIEVSCCLK